ncbi:MAG: PKD domain-containing protein [Flavobacteriales bacterium]
MKTLNPLWLCAIVGFFLVLNSNTSLAQCSVNAGPDISRCLNQVANLGANVTVSGGTAPYDYSWNGGTTWSATPSNNVIATTTTTYTITIEDALGCTASDQITLTVLPLPVVNAGPDVSICPGASIQLCGTASSSNGPIATQLWLGGPLNACYTVSPANTSIYTFSASDASFCQATDLVTVTVYPTINTNAGADQTLCLSVGSMQLTGTPAGGTWSGSGVSAGGLFTAPTTGNFNLTYSKTSPQGCVFTDAMTMTVINPSPPNGGPDVQICLNNPAFQLPSVGTWSGSSLVTSGGIFSPSTVGTHNLTVTSSAGGCTTTDNVSVQVLPLPVLNAGSDVALCNGQSIQLSATASSANGAITDIAWTGSWLNNTAILNPIATPTATTTYNIFIADAANCSATDAVLVTVNSIPTVNAGSDITLCSNAGATQLTGFSPAGGTWSGAGVNASGLFTPSATGNFTLTYSYTSAQGCNATDTKVVTVIAPDVINAGLDITPCLNSAAVQLLGGGTWSGSTLVTAGGLFTPSAVGTYTLTYTTTSGLCQSSDQITAQVLALPIVNAGIDQTICSGQTANLNGSATTTNGSVITYQWTGGTVANSSSASTTSSPTLTTIFTLTAADNASCQSSHQITIAVNPTPVVNAGADQTLCTNSGATVLTGFSPAGGTWSGAGVNAGGTFTPTTAGNFLLTYTYTTGLGCSANDTKTITVITPAVINAGSDQSLCLNTLPIQLLAGGTWSGSTWVSAGGLFTPGQTGLYNLTYSAISGQCTSTDNVTISVLALPTVNAGNDQSICAGQTANLNGNANSGNGAISTYAWTGGVVANSTSAITTTTPAGTTAFTLTATDAAGCQSSDQTVVTVNAIPVVEAGNDQTLCTNSSATTLTGYSPAGGTWSGTGVNASGVFTPTVAGSFVLTYTYSSGQGCTSSDTKTITVITPDVINAGVDMSVCMNTPAIQLMAGGTWTGSSSVTAGGLFTPTQSGIHNLTYTAISGLCTSTDNVVVTVMSLPTVNAGSDQTICLGQTANLNGSASSNNGAIASYVWTGANITDINDPTTTASPVNSGNYILTATDVANCTSSDNASITVNPLPAVNAGNDIALCDQPIAHQLTGFSPAGGVWSGLNVTASGVFTPNGTGTFNLTYCFTNNNNCQACDHITVTVNSISPPDAGADMEVCLNAPSFNLNPITPGGTWTTSAYLTAAGVFTPSVAGIYNCVYTLGSGTCMISDIKVVTVNGLPAVNAGADGSICEGSSHSINASITGGEGPFDYTWNNGASLNANDIEDVIATPNITTSYTLTVQDANLCGGTDAVNIIVVPLAHADFDVADTSCMNANVAFTNNSTDATSYSWSFGNGSNSIGISPSTSYPNAGTFVITLQAFNSLGCMEEHQETIEIIGLPVADFSLSANIGCSPLEIQFNNQSTGIVESTEWNLGGNISNDINPAPTTFEAELDIENYTITLTTSNQCGSDLYSENITVNPRPHAQFSTNLSSQCSPVVTQFVNESAGYPDSFYWDLGNGEESDDETPSTEIYLADEDPFDYTIKLVAVNTCGSDSTESVLTVLPNTVEINLQPSVNIGCSPLFVEFNNGTAGATSYFYEFDDGSTSSVGSPNHIFDEPGIYDVVFYANDGCSYDTTTVSIEVLASPTITISSNVDEACPDQLIEFTSTTEGSIQFITWDFGDSNQDTGTSVEHSYSSGNTYGVSATAQENNGCSTTAAMNFIVHPKPFAMMSANPALGCSPLQVCTDNTTTGSNAQVWNFDNGYQSDDVNTCYEFINTTGNILDYEISLHVSNEFGCTDSAFQIVSVQPQPETSFTLSSNESCFPLETINTNVTTTGSSVYEWIVDGSFNSAEMTPSFSFFDEGEHTIHLISMNDYGCTDTFDATYTIHPKPSIDVTPDLTSGCMPLEVSFANNTNNGEQYDWSFSNGESSNDVEPTILFEDMGIWDVQVHAVSEHGCESVLYIDSLIEVFGLPTADFNFDPNGDIIYDLDVAFADSSVGAIQYHWDFGDGFTSNEINPTHHYATGGAFHATQIVTNEFGCTDEKTQLVNIDNTYYIFIPNSFTPDHDGINDLFKPEMSTTETIRSYEFIVMNRWGELIFKTDDPGEGWNGSIREGQYYAHNDCFTWTVKIEFNDKQVNQLHSGNVTVLR